MVPITIYTIGAYTFNNNIHIEYHLNDNSSGRRKKATCKMKNIIWKMCVIGSRDRIFATCQVHWVLFIFYIFHHIFSIECLTKGCMMYTIEIQTKLMYTSKLCAQKSLFSRINFSEQIFGKFSPFLREMYSLYSYLLSLFIINNSVCSLCLCILYILYWRGVLCYRHRYIWWSWLEDLCVVGAHEIETVIISTGNRVY